MCNDMCTGKRAFGVTQSGTGLAGIRTAVSSAVLKLWLQPQLLLLLLAGCQCFRCMAQ
jgi:hypothetical protein